MDEQLDMNFEAEKDEDGSFIPSTIKISFKNSLLNHKLGVYMRARELQENDDSKIIKKGVSGISVKIYPENE